MEGSHIWQLVDQVVPDQRAYELKAAGDDDVPVHVLLQRRDLVKHGALEDCRVVPGGIGEGSQTRRTWAGCSACPPARRCEMATARRATRSFAAQKEGPGGQRIVERELGKLRAISDQADPAAGPEAFVTGRSWMTPSSVTFSLTTIFPISVRRLAGAAGTRRWRRALRARRASRIPPVTPPRTRGHQRRQPLPLLIGQRTPT